MARRRRIRWPGLVATLLLTAGVVLLLRYPAVLAPSLTRLVNRQLLANVDGELRVGEYHFRPFAGFDATDVAFVLRDERGGLIRVAVDSLELDFRLREVIGRGVHLRRLAMKGVKVYHNLAPPDDEPRNSFSFPRLTVDLVDLDDVQLEVSDSDGRLREEIHDLSWRGVLRGDGEQLRLTTRSSRLDWVTRNARFSRLYAETVIDANGLRIDELGVFWNEGRASVRGTVGFDGSLALDATGSGISVVELTDLTDLVLDFPARGDIDCRVVSRNDSVFFRADFTGRFADWDLDAVHAEAVIVGDVADFTVLRGGVGGAWFDGTLQVDARNKPDVVISVIGEGRNLDLATGLIPGEPADLPPTSGHGHLEIVHRTADLSTVVRGDLYAGSVAIMPFDSCRVEVWAREDSLHFRSIDLRLGTLHANLTGSSDSQEVFRGDLDLVVDDLRDLPPDWAWPELLGGLAGRIALSGPLDDLTAAGHLEFHDFELNAVQAGAGQADFVAERALGEDWQLSAAIEGDHLVLGGVPLGQFLARTRVDPTSVALDSFRTVLSDTMTSLHGSAYFSPDRTDLVIDRLELDVSGAHWQTDATVTAVVGPGRFELPGFRLVSEQGELSAAVTYDEADSLLAGDIRFENFDLDLLNLQTGGRATATVTLGGRPGDAELAVHGELTGARFPLARIDSLAVDAHFHAGVVRLDTLAMVTDYGRVALRGSIANPGADLRAFWPDAALDLDVLVAGGKWSFLDQLELEALATIAGDVDGRLRVTGTTRAPLITGDLDSAPFHYQWLHLDRLTGTIRAENSQLALGDLSGHKDSLRLEGRLEIPMVFDLLSEPITPEDGPFYGRLTIPPDSDLAPLKDATNGFTRISGRGEVEVIVSGPLSHPRYQGELSVRDFGFVLRGSEEVYHDFTANGVFRDDYIILQEFHGQEGLRGTVDGVGTVTFEGLLLKTWDISFKADRFLLASIPDLRVIVRTQNGHLTGVAVGPDSTLVPRFSGDFEVIKGRYTGSFNDPGTGADPTLGNIFPDWLADVRVTGPPRSVRISNHTMELELSGDVTLVRTAAGMTLNGGMNIDKGRLPVFNNSFNVVRGSLDFSREVGVEPNVDIDAETRVRLRSGSNDSSIVERITVHATGPVNAMEVSFSSESGYPREAIERMLLGLSPYPDDLSDQNALANAGIGAGFNLIEREIAREIDIVDTIEIDQIQRQQAGSPTLDPLIGVGKYFGSDLYIKYARGLNQNDSDFVVEYQINDHLLLQTEMRSRIDEYQGDPTYNLDLKYRFEY